MNMAAHQASQTLRRLLEENQADPSRPSASFMGAGHGPELGPTPQEVDAAIKKLADAEAANDSSSIVRALAALVKAL